MHPIVSLVQLECIVMAREKKRPLLNVMLDSIVMVMLLHQMVEHLFQTLQRHVQLVIFVQRNQGNPNPVRLVNTKLKLANQSALCAQKTFIVR